MWFIECEGEVLGGKRLWLRPNQRFAIGRTPSQDVNLSLPSQKSISRIHLLIEVGDVKEGDGLKLNVRPSLKVQDHKTKHGTRIDGQEIRDQMVTLDEESYSIHLGKYEPTFRLYWDPIVFSVSLSSKDRKDKRSMIPYQNKVEALGIKTLATFVPSTTHVVASKRNTAIGLQALINGKFIVTSSYLDAVAQAASVPPDGRQSALEQDFDGNWPNPEEFLPPSNNEPGNRSSSLYRPDKARRNIFEGYTFIFCDNLQYNNFLGPVTDAHGKLERYDVRLGETTPEKLAEFVRKRSHGTNTAVVRFIAKKNPEWENDLSTRVQEILGYRMVEQNEFLDIILTGDTSRLRKPLDEDFSPTTRQVAPEPPRTSKNVYNGSLVQIEKTIIEETSVLPSSSEASGACRPALRGRGRTRTRAIPKLIDPFSMDHLDPPPTPAQLASTQFTSGQSLSTPAPRGAEASAQSGSSFSKPSASSNNTPMGIDEPRHDTRPPAPLDPGSRKRSVELEDEQGQLLDVMDLLPGAQAVKRRKLIEEEERALWGEPLEAPPPLPLPKPEPADKMPDKTAPLKGKGKRVQRDEDPFVIRAREIKEKQEEAVRVAKEEELMAMEGLDVDQLKNLAIVEVMEVKPRTDKPSRAGYGDQGARWEAMWNGRKNFKKFVRSGRGGGMRAMRGNVMVNLVEHRGRDYGIGYWLDNEEETPPTKKSQKVPAQQLQQVVDLQEDSNDCMHALRPGDRLEAQVQGSVQTHPLAARTRGPAVTSQGTKRGAIAQGSRAGAGKKQKTLVLRDGSGSDDDSDDELRFKFKKR
ncbi:unnamed protein product [Tuber melanosporum]|uniref:(Perigord truffle) hypothetical protein n=1 Tax=Tuber melanosporum (strain Mel28) TaxID=656061 RepID=D5G7X4_TUBMM|nr:uncharacterized protein GSTUM_00002619001 [Tuber melanosporum]CAZ80617.1 unnamed protein product [Tuber melanosporum]